MSHLDGIRLDAPHVDDGRPGEHGPDLPSLTNHMNVLLIFLIGRLATGGSNAVKAQISSDRCQGHGRCYDLAPGLFGEDEEGYGTVLGAGVVPPGQEHDARLAAANCPEHAVEIVEAG